eukprot:629579-Amorphochlora_amoeboformis.AAC.1
MLTTPYPSYTPRRTDTYPPVVKILASGSEWLTSRTTRFLVGPVKSGHIRPGSLRELAMLVPKLLVETLMARIGTLVAHEANKSEYCGANRPVLSLASDLGTKRSGIPLVAQDLVERLFYLDELAGCICAVSCGDM